MDERGVEFRTNSLEHHSKEVVVGLKYALFGGESLNVFHALRLVEHVHHRVVHHDRLGCGRRLQGVEVGYLYVAAESHYFVPYGMLESKHHADADYHYCKSDCHTRCGNTYSRLRYLLLVVSMV